MLKDSNENIRQKVLAAVNGISDDTLNQKPADNEWSSMGILEHLYLIENYIAQNLLQKINQEKSEKAFKKPIQLTLNRIVKVAARTSVVPSGE